MSLVLSVSDGVFPSPSQFGSQVTEGLDIVEKINEAFCDDAGRPYQV